MSCNTQNFRSLSRLILTGIATILLYQFIFAASPTSDKTPQRIILNLTETPDKSMAVTWRTKTLVNHPSVQFAPALASVEVVHNRITITAKTDTLFIEKKAPLFYYSAQLEPLTPDTRYAYRVGSEGNWSEWNQFQTASDRSEPFTFINFGDPQNEVLSKCSRVFRAAYEKAPTARFWHFTGDLINHGDRDEEWEEFFQAFGWVARTTPIIMLPGNHSYPRMQWMGTSGKRLNPFWKPQFTLPKNGPEKLEETTYFVDYQGTRFVMLNTNEGLETQALWLDSLLTQNQQTWTIVALHEPLYSTGRDRNNELLRNLFLPVFDKHHVDLVLQGHDHTYGRTYKLNNGKRVPENEAGTVYVVSVSGPKVYSINSRYLNLMAKTGNGIQLFQEIRIDGNTLQYASYTAVDSLFDSFTLTK